MIADENILQLSKISLSMKHLLPEYSGIYYVLDENNHIWYIGKTKNLNKRWQGKAHHRIDQLESQKKRYFTIYYEQVSVSQLDHVETQRIETYCPELNSTPVKTKAVRPTETLLRETIIAIADFAFILGVEPPRKDIQNQPQNLNTIDWMVQKRILGLSIIHICLDLEAFATKYQLDTQNWQNTQGVIRQAFNSRKAYANKWENLPPGLPPTYSFMYRLYVNGYVIEVNYWKGLYLKEEAPQMREYIETTLAKEPINALTPESLANIQNQADQDHYYTFCLKRLKPYNSDLIEILFNDETLEREAINATMSKVSQEYKTGMRGLGSRSRRSEQIKSTLVNSEFNTIEELLLKRGINLHKYEKREFRFSGIREKIGLFVKCFSLDPQMPSESIKYSNGQIVPIFNSVSGILNNQKVQNPSCRFDTVYVLAGVDKIGWLLFEEYLKDFADLATNYFSDDFIKNLSNGSGYLEKFYISPRKYIVPARVNIKIEKIGYSVGIPFGMNENFPTFPSAKAEISNRLKNSGLPNIKLSFKSETIGK